VSEPTTPLPPDPDPPERKPESGPGRGYNVPHRRDLERDVKRILAREPLSPVDHFSYHVFARNLNRQCRRLAGKPEFTDGLAGLLEKWARRGLKRGIMMKILGDLFIVRLPSTFKGSAA